jgi:hypothetical protein
VLVDATSRRREWELSGRTSGNTVVNFRAIRLGRADRAGRITGANPNSLRAATRLAGAMQIEMTIKGLMVDPITNMPIIILRDKDGQRVLPIWVGVFEANAIALQIENVTTPRPMTHDLLKNVIADLHGRIEKIVVSDLKENTFYALIYLDVGGESWRSTRGRATRSRWRCGRGRRFSSRRRSSTTPRRSTSRRKRGDRAAAEVARVPRSRRHGQVQDVACYHLGTAPQMIVAYRQSEGRRR